MKGQLFAQIPPLAPDVDVSMDDSHVSAMSGITTESMLSLPSPPRTQRRKQRNTISLRSLTHGHGQSLSHGNSNNTVRSRLFEDEEDNNDPKHDNNSIITTNNIEPGHHLHHRHHRSRPGDKIPSILKPIDLNLDFTESESPINNNNSDTGGGGLINNNISNATTAAGAAAPSSPTGRRTSSVNAAKSSSLTPHPPSRPATIALRKRQAEHHDLYGKDWSFEKGHNDEDIFSVMESPVDMYTSPRISPYSPSGAGSGGGGNDSNYSNKSNSRMSIHRSPFLYGGGRASHPTSQQQQLLQTHKSPSSFQTIDGRTVQSNNPFSPMIFDETPTPTPDKQQLLPGDSPAPRHPLLLVNDSLIFPVSSLSGDDSNGRNNGSGTGGRGSHLVLRHKLQKRASSPSGAIAGNIQHQNHLQHPIAAAAASNNMGISVRMDGLMPPPLPSKDIIINNKNHNNNNNNNNPIEQRASLYIRDGYPEQTGRYSFTGSPIKEQIELSSTLTAPTMTASATSSITEMSIKSKPSYDCCDTDHNNNNINMKEIKVNTENTQEDFCANIHKIRRRRKDDDVVAAAAQGEASWKRKGMYIQTNNKSGNNDDNDWGYYNNNNDQSNYNYNNKTYYYNKQKSNNEGDNISPTDVINFPAPLFRASPSNSSTVPPAPSKPIRRPPSRRYTPIRKPIGPPPMPMVRKSRSFEEEDTSIFGNANDGNDHNRDDESSDEDDDGDDRISNVAQRRRRRRPKSGGMDYLNMSPREGVDVGGEQAAATPPSRFYSDFDVISELGSGSFGNVFQALSRLDGCMYAIKVAHRVAKGNADKDRMLKEVYALAALSDQADTATFHIVRYHQAWMEEQRLYIQTELCSTTLQAEMEQVAPMQLPLPTRYKCMREILLALEFIHKNGMVHLDIKPENIFLKNDQFKLGDFGLVSKVSSHDVEEGDSRYMSMELLSGDHADLTKSDIFSLGITMYELCLGRSKALPSNGPKWQSLRSGCIIPPPNTTDNLLQIIKNMMNPTYQERPCASDLLKLPELLSDEQKMLYREREKVVQANQALAAQSKNMMTLFPRVPRPGGLVRRNTWSAFT